MTIDSDRVPFALGTTYAHLGADGAAELAPGGAPFWSRSGEELSRLYPGWLVTSFPVDADMRHWEMHPAGDEILVLLAGAIGVAFATGDTEQVVELATGAALVVPRGVWHRQLVRRPGRLLAMTYGKDTEHRPIAPVVAPPG